jgi:GNAT superfamily N-acetyltransferase
LPTSSSPDLLAHLAEDAWAYVLAGAAWQRPGYALVNQSNPHPLSGSVHRVRLQPGRVDELLESARRWFAFHERKQFAWFVGESATPGDLVERLRAAGATQYDEEPLLAAMVLTDAPEPVEGVEVRRVLTLEDFVTTMGVQARAFGLSEEEQVERAPELWDPIEQETTGTGFLALLDGEPVGSAAMLFTTAGIPLLLGANVLPHARGRGLYRALVRARWEEARRRGASGLVVQAGQMSRPILERLGFRTVSEIEVLLSDV